MEVGAVKQAFNNEVILLKKKLAQAKTQVIHKLTRKAKQLAEKKAPDKLKEKLKRKSEAAVSEVMIIKKIKPKDIAKFIVTHKGELKDFLNKPFVDNDKACARLLLHKVLQDKYEFFRGRFGNVAIKDLFMSRQERKKLKKEAMEKQKNKKKSKDRNVSKDDGYVKNEVHKDESGDSGEDISSDDNDCSVGNQSDSEIDEDLDSKSACVVNKNLDSENSENEMENSEIEEPVRKSNKSLKKNKRKESNHKQIIEKEHSEIESEDSEIEKPVRKHKNSLKKQEKKKSNLKHILKQGESENSEIESEDSEIEEAVRKLKSIRKQKKKESNPKHIETEDSVIEKPLIKLNKSLGNHENTKPILEQANKMKQTSVENPQKEIPNKKQKLAESNVKPTKNKMEKKQKSASKNKNFNEKVLKRKFAKDSGPVIAEKAVDPFFMTASGDDYMTVVEPRAPDEFKDEHKHGNRKLRRAAKFGHFENAKPRRNNSYARQSNQRQRY